MSDLEYFETAARDFGAEDKARGLPMMVRRSFLAVMLEVCLTEKDEALVKTHSLHLYDLYREGYNR